ncbi:MAG: hypothetical protein WAV98_02255 [Minisyncoccia bacterium]
MLKNSRDKLNELHGYKKAPVPIKKELNGDEGNFVTRWWEKDNPNSKKRVWLIILSVVVMLVAGASMPKSTSGESSPENVYLLAGIISMLGVHIIWGVYSFDEKVSWMETTILYGIIFFYGLTLVFSQVVPIRNAGWSLINKNLTVAQESLESAVINFGKTPPPQPSAIRQSTRSPRAILKTTKQPLYAVPGGNFQKAETPRGARVIEKISFNCPQGCISQVEHDGYRMCETENGNGLEVDRNGNRWYWGSYQNTKCLVTTIPGAPGIVRYRERFLKLPNSKLHFPADLIFVIYSFGASWGIDSADRGFGPVPVDVTMTTM